MTNDNITKFPSSGPPPGNSGGGNGNDFDSRLRSVEIDLATIKERTANMATKNDVTMLKVWILGGLLGGIPVAVTVGMIAVKFLYG